MVWFLDRTWPYVLKIRENPSKMKNYTLAKSVDRLNIRGNAAVTRDDIMKNELHSCCCLIPISHIYFGFKSHFKESPKIGSHSELYFHGHPLSLLLHRAKIYDRACGPKGGSGTKTIVTLFHAILICFTGLSTEEIYFFKFWHFLVLI